ncbi:unnamed protein product [Penicillium salamii]|uniref:DUF7905 domain-containing protein n=1 Tax=Penicillium salamii TaxID=1612424 RepID=A0A9W4J9I9_9EURO|nr:unnamed protein product [Penicillium salamii]CAG8383515.1 unnamed protein product [Penicillium salamii]CAG8384375.1 unnamed protein product [Penicillium salamii]CAG8385861.1 unnamed protein product [Penicillium salamii]
MEWEKEGAESWALPNYGPPRSFIVDIRNDENPAIGDSSGLDNDYENTTDLAGRAENKKSLPPLTSKRLTPAGRLASATRPRTIQSLILRHLGTNQIPYRHQNATEKGGSFAHGRPGWSGQPGQPGRLDRPWDSRRQRGLPKHDRKPSLVPGDSVGKAKWRKGNAPDGTEYFEIQLFSCPTAYVEPALFRLPFEYALFEAKVAQADDDLEGTVFCIQLISKTGAYVRVKVANAKVLEIWGRDNEVSAAQKMVQSWVDRINPQGLTTREPIRWDKIHAHSNTQVVSSKAKEAHSAKSERLRHEPENPTDFLYIFLWPRRGPSLDDCLSQRRQQLDQIREGYAVHLYKRDGVTNRIFVSGNSAESLCEVADELREMWRGLAIQAETEIALFLLEPPTSSLMTTDIIVETREEFSKPVLCGIRMPKEEAIAWESLAQGFKQENKDVIQTHLRKALGLVPNFNELLQMRAKFGCFFLDTCNKPANGSTYSFKEFREVLRLGNVEGRLLPGVCLSQEEIFKRIKAAKDLLAPWAGVKLDSLMEIIPKHSASFDYRTSSDEIIRIEMYFSLPYGTCEFEVNGSRCFKRRQPKASGDPKKPMQIGMIDFERADWQIEIKALTIHKEREVAAELDRFKRSMRYKWNPSATSIGSLPQRKGDLPNGAPIDRFVEKSAIQLIVIGTPYVFELSRFDEYVHTHRHWPKVPTKISWGATLFNPEWDDILAAQANGNLARTPCLSSFFPASPRDIAKAKEGMSKEEAQARDGEIRQQLDAEELKRFMSKVQTLARMMGSAHINMDEVLQTDIGTLF